MSSTWITNAVPVTQIAVAAASIGASYTNVGNFTVPLEQMVITSNLDQAVQLSFDGTNDHIPVLPGSSVPQSGEINFKTNNQVLAPATIWLKRIGTPTTGSIYI